MRQQNNHLDYKDPILEAIKAVLNEHGPATLKGQYSSGDPVVVSKSQLTKPMVFITFDGHTVGETTNSHLDITGRLTINLVNDMTSDFGQGLDARSHMQLVNLMIGMEIDGDSMRLKPDSIVGALRGHQNLGKGLRLSLGEADQIEYDAMSRGKGIVTNEAVLNTVATVMVVNPKFVPQS